MKRIISFATILLLCLSWAFPAYAAPAESDLVYLDKAKSVVFWVSWDKHRPDVVFLAPDGTEYDPRVTAEDTAVVESATDLYYIIQNAQAGQWRVRLDKGSNTKVDISVHDYMQGIVVEKFETGAVDGNRIPVTFRIDGGQHNLRVQYRISAMIERNGAEKQLASGYAYVGKEKTERVRLDDLTSYDAYILKLYVWYDNNGTDIFDFAFSQPFSYTNQEADARSVDYTLIIEPENQLLYVEWGELNWRVDGMLVAVFEDGAAEPQMFDEYQPDASPVQLSYDPAASEVEVEVTVNYDGVNAKPVRKTAKLGADMPITIPEGTLWSALQLPMTYQGMTRQELLVEINEKYTSLVLDGDGTVNLALQDDWNRVRLSYTDGNGVTWRINREIFVDRQPPVLTMDRPYDGMVLEEDTDSITISGTALDCETLLVNGNPVEMTESGTFSKTIDLEMGDTAVTVTALDAAGNESRYTATLTRGQAAQQPGEESASGKGPGSWYGDAVGPGSLWVLAATTVLCLCVLGYAFIFWRGPGHSRKRRGGKG